MEGAYLTQPCECGCGQTVNPVRYKSHMRRYLPGHQPAGNGAKWTDAERLYLTDNYEMMMGAELAIALGRSRESVDSYAVKVLGLRKGGVKRTPAAWFAHYTKDRPETGCWVWSGTINSRDGYGTIVLSSGYWLAHRLSLYVQNGRLPRHLDVLHKCDNKPCARPGHLYLGTDSDNQRDRAERGGDSHQRLTPDDAVTIRDRYAAGGITQRELAAEYGVTGPAISAIVIGRSWSWVGRRRAAVSGGEG